MVGKLKDAGGMMKKTSHLMREGDSGIQMSRRRLNCGMGRRGARGNRHIGTGTSTSVTEERIIGEGREEMSESGATTIECVGGFD